MSECVNLFFLLFDKEFDLWWDVNGMKHCLMEGRGEILKILTIYSQVGKEVHLRRHISLSISCINWHLLHYLILKKNSFNLCILERCTYIFDFSHQTHVYKLRNRLYVVNTSLFTAHCCFYLAMFMSNCLYNSGNFRWKVSLVRLEFSIKFCVTLLAILLTLTKYFWPHRNNRIQKEL